MRRVLLPQQLLRAIVPGGLESAIPGAMQLRVALPLAIFLHKALYLCAHALLSVLSPGLLISICPYACLRGRSGWHAAAGSSVFSIFPAQSRPPAHPALTHYAVSVLHCGKFACHTPLSAGAERAVPGAMQLPVALPLPSLHKAFLLSIEDIIGTW